MATWHQQQAMRRTPRPLWHETKWTVVNDPVNGPTTLASFDEATAAIDHAKKCGGYVLAPAPGGRR